MIRRRILSSTSVLLLFTMGCYVYVPSAGSGLPPVGEQVQVDVTESEATRLNLAAMLPRSPTILRGELVSNGDDSIEILVQVADPASRGFIDQELFQRIEVGRDGIQRVTRRELSTSRTALALGTGVLIVAGVLLGSLTGFVGGGTEEVGTDKR